jgi:hypothetical protein
VVCLLSKEWESRVECLTEYRTAEALNKRVFCARLEPDTGTRTSAWQWCDLFGDGPTTRIEIGDGDPVGFATRGLYRLRDGIRGAGIGADTFVWPVDEPDRSPYRGWAPFDPVDAGIFFGRDAQIVRALDAVRGMRKASHTAGVASLGVPRHAVRQADRQYEPPTMAGLGLTRYRIHAGVPQPAYPPMR